MTPKETQDLLMAVPLPMMVIGKNRQVVAINPPLEAFLGRGLVGRHFITALRQPILLEALEEAMRTKTSTTGRYLGRDGQKDTTYLVHIAPVGSQIALTFEDRTAKEDISQLRRDFVANVSHELRTPLTALYGFIETLRGAAKDDPVARDKFLGIMERETQRMTRLVGDLLSLSRVEENERIRPSEPVILSELVGSAISELSPVLENAAASVDVNDQSGAQPIPGDPEQLRQVIGNLLENAVKYGPREGQIDVCLGAVTFDPSLRAEGITLQVTNQGDGIAPHHIPRLTERFYRVDAHRSREIGGTGLGLAIVKHIVNRHRGRMRIESELGAATTVSITLPAHAPADRTTLD